MKQKRIKKYTSHLKLYLLVQLGLFPAVSLAQKVEYCSSLFQAGRNSPTSGLNAILGKSVNLAIRKLDFTDSERLEYLLWRHRKGFESERILKDLPEIIELSKKFLVSQSILFESIFIDVNPELQVPALQIIPKSDAPHSSNRLAAELERSHFGLHLIYEPYTLLQYSGSASFSPAENHILIPHEMIRSWTPNSSFDHEMIHAGHFRQRLMGQDSPFFGTISVGEGGRFNGIYRKNMTFEELNTTSVANLRLSETILKLGANGDPFQSSKVKEPFEQLLNELYIELKTGSEIAGSVVQYLDRVLESIDSQPESVKIDISEINASRQNYIRKILIAKVVVAKKGNGSLKNESEIFVEIPLVSEKHLTEFKLGNVHILKNELRSRLVILKSKASLFHSLSENALQKIPLDIADRIDYSIVNWVSLQKQLEKLVSEFSQQVENPNY